MSHPVDLDDVAARRDARLARAIGRLVRQARAETTCEDDARAALAAAVMIAIGDEDAPDGEEPPESAVMALLDGAVLAAAAKRWNV